ncbi:MAG: recombinase family protein [Paraclostridium sp.]
MKVAIYSRKSKFTGKGESIENQIQLCNEYAKNIGATEFLVYEDEGFSGKNLNRPEFTKMMEDAKSKKFDVIICYRLDRISRNVADFSNLIEELSSLSIGFISIKEQFDTTTPMGRAMMFISSVFAQLERETISERVRDNMRELARDGKWLGGQLPLGFDAQVVTYNDNGKERKYNILKENKEELKIVLDVFEKFTELRSLTKVSEYLYNNNLKGKNGGTIVKSIVKDILTNPIYVKSSRLTHEYFELNEILTTGEPNGCGYLTYGKNKNGKKTDKSSWIYAVSKHDGIIGDVDWLGVQKLISRYSSHGTRTGTSKNSLLSGILKCAKCGSAMVITVSTSGKNKDNKISYYKCNKKYTMYNCTNSTINAKEIDDFIIDKIKVTDKDVLMAEYEKLKSSFRDIKPSDGVSIQRDIDAKEKAIGKLLMTLSETSNATASKYILSQIERASDEVDELKGKLDGSSVVSSNIDAEILNIDFIVSSLAKFNECIDDASVLERKLLIGSVVDRITWDGDSGEVSIFYHGLD